MASQQDSTISNPAPQEGLAPELSKIEADGIPMKEVQNIQSVQNLPQHEAIPIEEVEEKKEVTQDQNKSVETSKKSNSLRGVSRAERKNRNSVLPVSSKDLVRNPGQRKEFHQKIFKTPKETATAILQTSIYKAEMSWDKTIALSFLSGVFAAMGGIFALTVYLGVPTLEIGLRKLLFGLTFPVGLVFIVLFGGELFTGNVMIMTVGLVAREISWKSYFLNLTISFFVNFLGCAFGAGFFAYWGQLFIAEPYLSGVQALAVYKVSLEPQVVFLRAIPANWLVNLAIFSATSAESIEGKILASFVAIGTFAASSLEHCVANMFFVTCGLMYGAETTFGEFIYKNLILAALGNFVGGALFVGVAMWWIYLRNSPVPEMKRKN